MRTWYSITNADSKESATVTIYDEIGMWGITARDFSHSFKAITAPIINLEINSPGGSVFDGVAIYHMLKGSGKTINAKVMGVAASIASIILMAADKIVMPANTFVMVHSPKGGIFGTAEEMVDMAATMQKVKSALVGTYMKRTGKSEDEVVAMLAKDTWMTAQEAKDAGFADEVLDAVEMKASFDMERIPEAARVAFKACAKPVAKTPEEIAADEAAAAEAEAAGKPVAEQIAALAKAAGFEAHAPAWAVKYTKVDEAKARITEASEIAALCVAAKLPDEATALIKAGKTLVEARTELTNKVAAADVHIDTTKKHSNQPAPGPSAVTTAGIWAKHRKQTTGV